MAAQAFDPYLETPEAATVDRSPAYKHANMAPEAALAELQTRGVLLQRQGAVRGVQTPIRLTGRLRGVSVHTALPDAERIRTPFEICDARLALALDDFAAILALHDIDEVVHYSMYRPGAPAAPPRRVRPAGILPGAQLPPLPEPSAAGLAPVAPAGSGPHAPSARVAPAVRSRPRSQPEAAASAQASPGAAQASRHPAGLAIDVAKLHKRGGEWLDVKAHFGGQIGARTCGPGTVAPADAKARELWAIICEASAARVFTYVLTPNYNLAHRDHFHMEIKPGARWFLVH